MPVAALPRQFVRDVTRVVGKDFAHGAPEVLTTYDSDACVLMRAAPDLVVLPANTTEVAEVVRLCNKHKVPFVARGAGTGLSGGTLPMRGGIFIGLSRMRRILAIDPDNRTATVETGVINAHLNRDAKSYGLFYAPDPSSQSACTLGGNIALNSGGIHCVKYGVTTDHILALEVVTPEGEILHLGGVHGHHSGIDWTGLFVGSEGTFGIATQAVVKLTPIPEATRVWLGAFDRVEDATDAVSAIMASGIRPAALEFMDDVTVRAVNDAFHIGFPESAQAVLLIELDGPAAAVEEGAVRLVRMLEKFSVKQLRTAEAEAERQALWRARKLSVAAYGRILPAFYLHDCVVPRSELTTLLRQIQEIGQRHNVIIGNVFHAGDGNLHPNILLDPRDAAMVDRVLAAGEEILTACLAVGGVLSGEHGIGIEKSSFMTRVFTEDEISIMRRLKTALDPVDLANPDKILPVVGGCGETKGGLPQKLIHAGAGWI